MPRAAPLYAYPARRMRAPEAARYVGLSETAFLALDLPSLRIGGTVGWLREDLDAWLDQQAGRAPAYADPKAATHALTQRILAGRRQGRPPHAR
jgi:predicted DNA-binding transcriptional regulator AlpA